MTLEGVKNFAEGVNALMPALLTIFMLTFLAAYSIIVVVYPAEPADAALLHKLENWLFTAGTMILSFWYGTTNKQLNGDKK